MKPSTVLTVAVLSGIPVLTALVLALTLHQHQRPHRHGSRAHGSAVGIEGLARPRSPVMAHPVEISAAAVAGMR